MVTARTFDDSVVPLGEIVDREDMVVGIPINPTAVTTSMDDGRRKCFLFWTCSYQSSSTSGRCGIVFWSLMAIATILSVMVGLIATPILVNRANDPFVYKDTCKVLSCHGQVATLHPQSSYRDDELAIETKVSSCSSLFVKVRDDTIGCYVRRVGQSPRDLVVTLDKPGLILAIAGAVSSWPLLIFIVSWLIITIIYQRYIVSVEDYNEVLLDRLIGLAIVLVLFIATPCLIPAAYTLGVSVANARIASCVVERCVGDEVAVLKLSASSDWSILHEPVQFNDCHRWLNKTLDCFIVHPGTSSVGEHLSLTRPNFAIGLWLVTVSAGSLIALVGTAFAQGLMQHTIARMRMRRERHLILAVPPSMVTPP